MSIIDNIETYLDFAEQLEQIERDTPNDVSEEVKEETHKKITELFVNYATWLIKEDNLSNSRNIGSCLYLKKAYEFLWKTGTYYGFKHLFNIDVRGELMKEFVTIYLRIFKQ